MACWLAAAACVRPSPPASEPRVVTEQDRSGAESSSAQAPAPEDDHIVFEARDATLRGELLLYVSPGGDALVGYDLERRGERWRVSLVEHARSTDEDVPNAELALIHALEGTRVLVQTQQRFVTVDTPSGERVADRPAPIGWRFVWRNHGACALRTDCAFEPISCEDGAPLGAPLFGQRTHRYHRLDGSRGRASSHCESPFRVVGGARGLSFYLAGTMEEPTLIARDAQGAERWRSGQVSCGTCGAFDVGVHPEEDLCWTVRYERPSARLRAFTCSTGRLRFERSFEGAAERFPATMTGAVTSPVGVFVQGAHEAWLLDPSGQAIWHRRGIDVHTLLVPEHLRVSEPGDGLSDFSRIERVRSTDGALIAEETAEGPFVVIADGGQVSLGRDRTSSDRSGRAAAPLDVFTFRRDRGGSEARVGERVVLRTEGDAWSLGEHGGEREAWLVVAEPRSNAPDRVHILRVVR
ncbi:MAG: hypothetical protein KF901_14435 [Myxococcales bacterium]|nr:hypothetical protein [Myxococcales bacterium]